MKRSEKELRRIAEHIVTELPEDDDDAARCCELALALKRWENERGEGGPASVSLFRRMKRSEKELRRIAEHIVTLLPEDDDDAARCCELALALKRWENERGEGGPASVSLFLRRK